MKQTKTEKTADAFSPLDYDVRIQSIRPEGAVRAIATVTINGAFAIRGVKVMEGQHGLFAVMPNYKTQSGTYKDICFPCTSEARKAFNQCVLSAYDSALKRQVTAKDMPEDQAGLTHMVGG